MFKLNKRRSPCKKVAALFYFVSDEPERIRARHTLSMMNRNLQFRIPNSEFRIYYSLQFSFSSSALT